MLLTRKKKKKRYYLKYKRPDSVTHQCLQFLMLKQNKAENTASWYTSVMKGRCWFDDKALLTGPFRHI